MVQIGLTIRMCLFTRRSLVLFPGCDVSISMDIRPVDEVLFEELSQSQYRQRTGAGGIGATRIRRERRENKRSVLMRRWQTRHMPGLQVSGFNPFLHLKITCSPS